MRTALYWLQNGGVFVPPLLLLGAGSLLLLVERTMFIVVRSKIHARPFIEKVVSLARADKLDEALELCAEHHAALPDLGLVILRSGSSDAADLAGVAESAKHTLIPDLTRRVAWLPSLAVIAVLLGLAGGVVNLHDALAKSPDIAAGLAHALRPIGIGLLLAIPMVAGHAYLVSEAQKLSTQLDEFALRLIDALVDRPDVRLGHRD